MKIQKQIEWVFPPGSHQAKIADIRECSTSNGGSTFIRIIFEITSLPHPFKVCQARAKFDQRKLPEFVTTFSDIVGEDEIARLFNMDGELMTEYLSALKGVMVDIETIHCRSPDYEAPYCHVSKIAKFGTLTAGFTDPPQAA